MSLNGIDISSYQQGLDLGTVPCEFAIIKATEGTSYVNPSCETHFQQGRAAGKKLGVYHFARGGDAGLEADFFLSNIRGYLGSVLLALDWEADVVKYGPGYAKAWLDRVQSRTGVKPLVYMSNSVVNQYDWSDVVRADYGLWNAGYYAGYRPMGYNPDAPIYGQLGAWGNCAVYQYTSSGRLQNWGGNLDLNVFYGDRNAWDAYVKGTVQKPESPQPVTPPKPSGSAPSVVDFVYSVRAGGVIYEEVTNLNDYAGVRGVPITDVAIRCSRGSVRYRVHVLGGGWLPFVTGYNWSDHVYGYAGNGQQIDAVEVYYYTPADIVQSYGYQKAQYRVSPVNGGYFSWQYDNERTGGQDGYAGGFNIPIDRFQIF